MQVKQVYDVPLYRIISHYIALYRIMLHYIALYYIILQPIAAYWNPQFKPSLPCCVMFPTIQRVLAR